MTSNSTNPSLRIFAAAALALAAALAGAPTDAEAQSTAPAAAQAEAAPPGSADNPHVVEVEAEDYAFRIPAEINSGWTTFRFANQGEEHHFLFITQLPVDVGYDAFVEQIVMPFNDVWYDLRDGRMTADEAMPALSEELPEWYWGVDFMGGVGFLAPGASAEATVYLEPGQYVVECYMRTPDGEIHSMEGMLDPLTVTAEPSEGSPPPAALQIVLSEEGMALDGLPQPGLNTFEVHWADHPEGTFGHDVQVLRVDNETTVDDVLHWMNFLNLEALTEPAPGSFVGGITPMPAGSTAYFAAELEPGRYILASQYTSHLGVLTEFTVEAR